MKQERGSIALFHTIIDVLCQMDRNLPPDAAGMPTIKATGVCRCSGEATYYMDMQYIELKFPFEKS